MQYPFQFAFDGLLCFKKIELRNYGQNSTG